MTGTSRSQIQAWVKDGNLMVNDKAVKSNYKVQEGDLLELTIPEPEQIKRNA